MKLIEQCIKELWGVEGDGKEEEEKGEKVRQLSAYVRWEDKMSEQKVMDTQSVGNGRKGK